jgi:hypothetical protein
MGSSELARKLGLKPAMSVLIQNAPPEFVSTLLAAEGMDLSVRADIAATPALAA